MADRIEEKSLKTSDSPQGEATEETGPQLHQDGAEISIQEGPFKNYRLIENLPTELEFVQFEALDENIYLGSSKGDLLHYFEIEPRNYMLVSQTQFDPDSQAPIDRIMLFPKIERALVLSQGRLVLFLLPEFAPVPNTIELRGVADVALRSYSERSKSYKFYAAKEDSIEMYKVTNKNLDLSKRYDFGSVSKVVAQGNHLAVARQNTYEIINVRSSGVIPLFRVSETNAPLRPIIANFNDDKFLVATGGDSNLDSSMALVVNHNGEMVNGTIVLENYPAEAIIEYPYLIVNYGLRRVLIYKLGGDSTIVQEIKTDDWPLRVARLSKVFYGFRRSEMKETIVEKLRKVPLIHEENQLKIENERVLVEQMYEEESSVAIYGKFGIHILVKNSPILDFSNYGESSIHDIGEYLREIPKSGLPKFKKVENDYLLTLKLLLNLLHCKNIDRTVIGEWFEIPEVVDVRLLLHILGFEIYGNIWIPKGLAELMENLKMLKLIHKCDDIKKMLHMIHSRFLPRELTASDTELENITKSVDVNIFKLELKKNIKEIDIDSFSECSLGRIAALIEEQEVVNLDLLLKVNQRRGRLMECIELLKNKNDVNRLLCFIEENAEKLIPSYKKNLIDDILFIISSSSQVDKELISHILKIFTSMEVDPHELLNRIGDNASVKVLLIEELGPANAHDKRFLTEYYMAKIQKCIQEEDVQESLKAFSAAYKQDMTYTKCSIKQFLLIKLESNESCRQLLRDYETLEAVNGLEDSGSLTASMLEMLKPFDKEHILALLFLPDDKFDSQFMTEEELLKIYLAYNDFMSIERYLTSENISQVLLHYASFEEIHHSLNLVTRLLQRNANLIKDEKSVRSVLDILPSDYTVSALFNFLFCILKRQDTDTKELELRKVLLKDEISINQRLLSKFSTENNN